MTCSGVNPHVKLDVMEDLKIPTDKELIDTLQELVNLKLIFYDPSFNQFLINVKIQDIKPTE